MAAILTPRVVRRMAGECTDVDERGAVGIRLEPAAAIDENQNGILPVRVPVGVLGEGGEQRRFRSSVAVQVFSKRSQERTQQLGWASAPAILSSTLCVAGFASPPT